MIVTCESCETQFKLEDAKIPDRGARVRCSRCKTVFFIASPSAAAQDVAHDVAQEVAREAREGGDAADDPEADWKFNDDPAPAAEAPVGGDAGSFGGFDSTPSGLAGAPDSDGDAEGLFETPGESGLDLAAADPDPTEAGEMDLGAGGDPIGADEHILTQESAESEPDRGAFDMPDSDDVPDAPDVQSPSTQPTPPPQSTALGQVGVVRVPASELGRSQRAPVEAEPEMTPAQRWLRRGVGAVGGSVVAALIGVAVLGGLLRGPAGADDAAYQLRVGALSAEDVAGHWVENASTGSIYIVSGVLRNPTGQLAVADGVIRARLVDAVGNPVYAESAVAGPSPSIERVREAALADLRQLQEAGAARMAHFALAPGSGLPFTAVFADVPPEATGFRLDVEPVSATPAPGFSGSQP